MSSNTISNRCLFLNNPKESIPNTKGITSLSIRAFDQLVSISELKTCIRNINVSNVVGLCIGMDNAEDVLRAILEIHPTLAKQLKRITGNSVSFGYAPLKCTSYNVFSEYVFPLVKKLELVSLPNQPLTGLPNATIYVRNIKVNKDTCENMLLNGIKKIHIATSKVDYIPSCEWLRFERCEFIGFDQGHDQNGLTNDTTNSIGFLDCDGELPSITFKAVTYMSVEECSYKILKLNNCLFPTIGECVLNYCESFDTSIISNVKKLNISGDTPNLEPCDNLESLHVYNSSSEMFDHMKRFKTKKLVIDFDHDEDWYPSYKVKQLAAIDVSKLKSVKITGAEAIGNIAPLKRKFEAAGVESCVINLTTDILKKVKTNDIHVVNNVKNQGVGSLVTGSQHTTFFM